MTALTYKGFTGTSEYSVEDDVFHGTMQGIRALVSYEAETEQGLQAAFEEAVDDYLESVVPTFDPTEP